MTVSNEFLSELVEAHEYCLKFEALRVQLLSKTNGGDVVYQTGEHVISISPVRRTVQIYKITKVAPSSSYNELSSRERGAIQDMLELLEHRFMWDVSPKGRPFWANLCNQLRGMLGRPLIA